MSFKYREYQFEAIEAVFNYFAENTTGHPLIAMPGGSGKAIVIVGILMRLLHFWPDQRALQLVHTKELVGQNHKKFLQQWENAPAGIYCAGLNRKDTAQPVIFGSLGSVRNNIDAFGHRDLVILDEAHALSPDESTGYQKIITRLTEINPNLRVIGLSATIFRLGQGMLTDKGFFTDVCFDITKLADFNRLIAEGYLSSLVPKRTDTVIDITGVPVSRGQFNQGKLQKCVDKEEITFAAIQEALQLGFDRHCWKVFCSGVEHSEHVAGMLNSLGIDATFIHSKISDDERDARFDAFETGKIKALCTYKIATTGWDHPPVDFIIDLYPTVSPGNHVQKYSRGTRPYDCNDPEQYIPGFNYVKRNCLVADFSGNTARLGPINDPKIPKRKGDKEGDAPIKVCTAKHNGVECGIYNHASARYCGGHDYPSDEGCGAEFIFKTKLLRTAGTNELIAGEVPEIKFFTVDKVIYHLHNKVGSEPSIKVSYFAGLQRFTEYVCLQHKGFARTRAKQWWMARHSGECPETTEEALLYVSQLRVPSKVRVNVSTKYKDILGVEW